MMFVFVVLGLLVCVEAGVTPEFVQTGKDLFLEVKEAVTLGENDILTWTFNNRKNIARLYGSNRNTFFPGYSGRAKVFPQNQTLRLKNMTKSDSGDYRARVSGDDPKVIAKYKVTVLDPVSPVKLTVKSCSSDSSNLTVTCSTQDSLLSRTFTCDDQSCSEETGEKTPAASLKVYLKNDSIICVHSNQVSRTEDVRKIEDFCKKDPGPEGSFDNISVCKVKIFVISSGLIIMVCVVISVHIMEKVKKRK